MFWTIVKRELIDHMMSLRFSAIIVLTVLLMVISVLVFSVTHEKAVKEYPRRVDRLVGEDGKTDLGSAPCQGGIPLNRFPSPLTFCSGTAERELPDQAGIAVHSLQAIERTSKIGDILSGSAHVDWAFVIAVLLSFGAGLLTYKSISGELRDGTLTLVLSHPIPRGTVLLGKYLAALLALTAALAIAMLISLIVLQTTGTVQFRGDDWLKIGLFGVVSVLYLSLFILIGLLCSVFTRSPLISAVIFLFVWTGLVFVIPNLGGILAGQIGHIKTPLQIKEIAETIQDRLAFRPGMSDDESASVALRRELALERLLMEYLQSLVRQVNLGQDLTRISPASAFSYAAEEIVGGGTFRLMYFINNVIHFRERFFQAMIEADKQDPESKHRYKPWDSHNFSKCTVDLGPAKEFRDTPPSSIEGLQAALMDLSLLILYNGLLFLIIFWRFARQDVAPTPGV